MSLPEQARRHLPRGRATGDLKPLRADVRPGLEGLAAIDATIDK